MSENTILGDVAPENTVTPESTQAQAQAPQPSANSYEDFIKSLDPEIGSDPSLKVFKDVKDLAKSYVHAQKMLGKDKTILPGKNSTPEEWQQLFHKLGVPQELDKYEIKKGEKYVASDEVINEFKKLAFENNLLPNQAQKMLDWFNDRASNNMTKAQADQQEKMQQNWQNLEKEWGAGFEKNIQAAKTVVKEFGSPEIIDYLNETGLGDDPKLVKFLAQIGQNLKEDSFKEEAVSHLAMTPQEAKKKYTEIMSDANHPYRNSMHPGHKEAVAEVNKLFEIM